MIRSAERLQVTGLVQGVGFRPFVHRLAGHLGLDGWVRNGSGAVEIELEGGSPAIDAFIVRLKAEAPALASIEAIVRQSHAPTGLTGFEVQPSRVEPDQRLPVPADVAACAACMAELGDPANRRYRYPFITCTDCGPRYTIIESLPYDRERSSMRAFSQCRLCRREYATPGDRRFHSETNSCPACGPRLWLEVPGHSPVRGASDAVILAAAQLLTSGQIIALRGVGGFHLAADATSETAVVRLRERKHREARPLALMVGTLAEARQLAVVTEREAEALISPARPIVLLEARESAIAGAVSAGLGTVGVMLAYTPLHLLLLETVGRPLVMTSGNLSETPIAIDNQEARERLAKVADGFLLHDRTILTPCDDSVVRVAGDRARFVRRARGFSPLPLPLPVPSPVPLLAVGPHLKNTLTLVHGGRTWISPHIGDLENLETLEHFHRVRQRLELLFRVTPRAVARDLHPGYLSTRIAEETGLPQVAVQHHHAHVAAVMAEHGVTEPVIGVAFDGTGYGSDGQIWGGEILEATLTGFHRRAHFADIPLPGGDRAARAPWRSALGCLATAPWARDAFVEAFKEVPQPEYLIAEQQIAKGINTTPSSSLGRIFDAAAAVLGVRRVARFEGQAAMELEALAGRRPAREIRCDVHRQDGCWILDPLPLLTRLGIALQRGEPVADLAADFHASIAWASMNVIRSIAEERGLRTVVLSGGVFQNRRLLESMIARLQDEHFTVLTPVRLGPNDGAISYGQAAVAAAVLSDPDGARLTCNPST